MSLLNSVAELIGKDNNFITGEINTNIYDLTLIIKQ